MEEEPKERLNEQPKEQFEFDRKRVIEAALFLANREMNFAELALIAKTSVKKAEELARELAREYGDNGSAISIAFEGSTARMEVKPRYLGDVAQLTKQVELSRKAAKILALIAKKGSLLQSQLRRYFRGDIYEYVGELKEKEYVSAEKHGLTRLLKPTKKFYETFQLVGEEVGKELTKAGAEAERSEAKAEATGVGGGS